MPPNFSPPGASRAGFVISDPQIQRGDQAERQSHRDAMPLFEKGKKPGPGRPKGMSNKTTQIAKDAIAWAAEGLGGAKRLVEWAKEDPKNEAAFWTSIYTKLLPLQVDADVRVVSLPAELAALNSVSMAVLPVEEIRH